MERQKDEEGSWQGWGRWGHIPTWNGCHIEERDSRLGQWMKGRRGGRMHNREGTGGVAD